MPQSGHAPYIQRLLTGTYKANDISQSLQNGLTRRERCENMTLNQMLYEATMEVLEGLGEEVMRSLVWQMEIGGVSFSPNSFDIRVFANALQGLFGDGADSLMEEIYQNATCRLELFRSEALYENEHGRGQPVEEGVLKRVHKLLTLFGEVPSDVAIQDDKD